MIDIAKQKREFRLLAVGFFFPQAQRLVEQLAVGDARQCVRQRFGARLAQRGAQLFHFLRGLGKLVRQVGVLFRHFGRGGSEHVDQALQRIAIDRGVLQAVGGNVQGRAIAFSRGAGFLEGVERVRDLMRDPRARLHYLRRQVGGGEEALV